MIPWVVVLLLLLAISGFLSASETALVGLSKLRLRHLVQRGVHGAKILQDLMKHLDEAITAILVSNNFVNAAISSLGAGLCIAWLGPIWGIPVATIVMGSAILVFGEVSPKVFAVRHAERVALGVAPAMRLLLAVLHPVARAFTAITNLLLKACGVELRPRSPLITEEELKIMIELGKEQGVLGEDERALLHRIFEFGDLKVGDVMIPREQMVAVHERASHDDVLTVITEKGHSRIPVYRDTPERITGILYAQELLHIWREGWLIVLQDLIHPAYEVTPDRRVSDLLQEFQKRHIQIAIVVDPQGRALGLVTIEDLIEEIVGELEERSGQGGEGSGPGGGGVDMPWTA
jgi:CBS domain containing-hemolysin-like protein